MSHVDDGMLHAYLDGELTPAERARLEEHLAECAACRARLDEERALVERAGALLALAEPPERAAPPLGQLRQPRLAWRVRVPLAWAATLLLAIGTGWYLRGLRVVPLADRVAVDSRPAAPSPARSRANAVDALRDQRQQDVAVTAGAASARSDSAAPIALQQTVVAEQHRAELKASPPAAAISSGTVSRDPTTTWPVIRREAAVSVLGREPLRLPGAAVLSLRQSPLGDGVVLVEQALDSATVIQLFQQRVPTLEQGYSAAQSQAPHRMSNERLARLVRGLRVEIAGPLSSDSLSKLLDLVK